MADRRILFAFVLCVALAGTGCKKSGPAASQTTPPPPPPPAAAAPRGDAAPEVPADAAEPETAAADRRYAQMVAQPVKELFDLIERLKSLEDFAADAIGKVLETRLVERADANPYFRLYYASMQEGPFASAEFQEPSTGARSNDRRLILTAPRVDVVRADVVARYGPGSISQIIPEAQPEGIVAYLYDAPGQKVYLAFTAESERLLYVTICRGSCL